MRCPKCNAKNDDGATFCSLCGEVFEDVSSAPEAASAPEQPSKEEGSAAIPGLYQTAEQLDTEKAKPTTSAIIGFSALMSLFAGLSLLTLTCRPSFSSPSFSSTSGRSSRNQLSFVWWNSDTTRAKKMAEYMQRPILVLFTTDDSSELCEQLKKEILNSPEFSTWANERVVLLKMAKLAESRTKQQKEYQKYVTKLTRSYKVTQLPTVIFTTQSGKEVSRMEGYTSTTPKEWVARAEKKLKGWIKPPKPVRRSRTTRRTYRR